MGSIRAIILDLFKYIRDNQDNEDPLNQTDVINFLQEKHGFSYGAARPFLKIYYDPKYAENGDWVHAMITIELKLKNGKPIKALRLHEEWEQLSDMEARDAINDLVLN